MSAETGWQKDGSNDVRSCCDESDDQDALLRGRGRALFALAAIGFERGKVSSSQPRSAAFEFPFFWDALAEV